MNGILIVDKPRGITSHDVVDLIRKRFGIKKVGHAGTLDPMATGVLVMLIGSSTKLSNLFIGDDKEYEAEMVLGAVSDTGDADGVVTSTGKSCEFGREAIADVFKSFSGEIDQVPHAYSAVKVNGKKLYELARRGQSVEVKPRRVNISHIEITDMKLPKVSFRVACSKGTYIRQLAADIGEKLGCGAYLSALRRTRSGKFRISAAVAMDALMRAEAADLEKMLIKV